jgi:hypothetical protein
MSLAQLPLLLRRKIPFPLDFNELGFQKLKDLILTMSDQVKLELKSHNHPFACLYTGTRSVNSRANSDDFKSIPDNRSVFKISQGNRSEDVNFSRHL